MEFTGWKKAIIALQIILVIAVFMYFMQKYYDKIQDFIVKQTTGVRWLLFMLTGFAGSMSVILPISPPYPAVVFFLSTYAHDIKPLELAFFTGLGASFGESISWFLGEVLFSFLPQKYKKRAFAIKNMLEKKKNGEAIILFLVFFFGLTPLPDDVVFIILGFIKYSLLKTLLFCFFGKFLLLYGLAKGGSFIGADVLPRISESQLLIGSIIGTIITLLIVIGIDWDELLKSMTEGNGKRGRKIRRKKRKKEIKTLR